MVPSSVVIETLPGSCNVAPAPAPNVTPVNVPPEYPLSDPSWTFSVPPCAISALAVGAASVVLGWYFNIRFVQQYAHGHKNPIWGDGSWAQGGGWSVGPVYSTAVYCTIMQLDNNCLPVYQR